MKKIIFIFLLMAGSRLQAQQLKDTVYAVRGYSCSCKYHFNNADDNRIFDRSQQPAQYPGGDEEWKKFLKKNLDSKLKGRDEVQFRFAVDKNGDANDFLLMNNAPVEKFNEMIRVIRLSGKWFPAVQGGFCVKSYVRMMLEF